MCVAQLDRALGYGPRCRGFESSRARMKKGARRKSYSFFSSVPSMALILLVKVQSRVFTAKCSEPQVGTSNGMDEGSGVTKFLSLRTET